MSTIVLTKPCKVLPEVPCDQKGYARTYWVNPYTGRKYHHRHRITLAKKLGRDLASWEQTRHLCHNPACWEEEHLALGTAKDNRADMQAAGRTCHGVRHPRAKLTPAVIAAARERQALGDMPLVHLARVCGVHVRTLRDALAGRTWADSEAA
jgi:hypothetical protein